MPWFNVDVRIRPGRHIMTIHASTVYQTMSASRPIRKAIHNQLDIFERQREIYQSTRASSDSDIAIRSTFHSLIMQETR